MNLDAFRDDMHTLAWDCDHIIEDDDVISMIIIMKDEKNPDGSPMQTLQDSMVCAAEAMLSLFARTGTLGRYDDLMTSWVHGRIRKVVKHAKKSKFDGLPSLLDEHGIPFGQSTCHGSSALVLIPLHASTQFEQWFRPIHRLKLQGYHAPLSQCCQSDDDHSRLVVTVNDDLHMSDGKSIAQFLHAVQVSITDTDQDDYHQWEHDGFRTYPMMGTPDDHEPVVIHDAGFTEIPANSLTASAMVI